MIDLIVPLVVRKFDEVLFRQGSFLEEKSEGMKERILSLRNSLERLKLYSFKKGHQYEEAIKVVYSAEDFIDNSNETIQGLKSRDAKKKITFTGLGKFPIKGTGGLEALIRTSKQKIQEIDSQIMSLETQVNAIHDVQLKTTGGNGAAAEKGDQNQQSVGNFVDHNAGLRREKPYEGPLIGFDHIVKSMSKLVEEGEPNQCVVILIVGMGGSGKTALAQKLSRIKSDKIKFAHAWVDVSKDYEIYHLLRATIKSFISQITSEDLDMMKTEELGLLVYESLQEAEQPYFLVMDDVWDSEAWTSLRRAFPDNKKGSRVIITTRIKSIAENWGERPCICELPFLNEIKSLELLKNYCESHLDYARRGNPPANGKLVGKSQDPSQKDIPELRRKLVEKCRGLPLALVELGELLIKPPGDVQNKDWKEAGDESSFFWKLIIEHSPNNISSKLDLCFDDLHQHLKLCILYLGLFPVNFEIKVDKLISLWMAEGFIPSGKEGTPEEVGMDSLEELIGRCLIQPVKRNEKRIATCRVHPALQVLIIDKSKELELLHTYRNQSNDVIPAGEDHVRPRRISSHYGFKNFVPKDHGQRTLLMFYDEKNDIVAELYELERYMKLHLLQVLDLEGTWFAESRDTGKTKLSEAVGQLIHLRYLGLNDTFIDELPSSIKTLQALQTIYLDKEILVSLPNEISKLTRLRHLFGRLKWSFDISQSMDLQCLGYIEVVDKWKFKTDQLFNLKELYVVVTREGRSFDLDSIGQLKSLQTLYLKVEVAENCSFPDLHPLGNCKLLIQLKLKGKIKELPKIPEPMHEIFPNLMYLYLDGSGIGEDPMPKLELLPKLTILDLYRYMGKEIKLCSATGFPQLEIFQLIKCKELKVEADDGGMPLLKGIKVPEGIFIPEKFKSIPAPKHWGNPHDDDWPYYPRSRQ